MADALLAAALLVLAQTLFGLWRVLRSPAPADRLLGIQLLGTGAIATLLLLAAATGRPDILDVALTLALVAAFAAVGFVIGAARR